MKLPEHLKVHLVSGGLGLFISVFLLALVEVFRISFLASTHVAFSYLGEFWLLLVLTTIFLWLNCEESRGWIWRAAAGLLVVVIYALVLFPLRTEQTIINRIPVQAVLGAGIIPCFLVGFFWKRSSRIESVLDILSLVLASIFVAADLSFFSEQYFGVHEVFLGAAFVTLFVGLQIFFSKQFHTVSKIGIPFALAGVVMVCVGVFASKDVRTEYRAESQLGKAVSSVALERQYKAISGEFFSPKPIKLFKEMNGVRSFDGKLEDYNVVFVVSETTRADETFLNNEKVTFTPHLKSFSKKSAVYENAIAPSSGTFQSISSVFSMLPPTMSPIDLWSKHWVGELRGERASVVESFQKAGWHTAWIGHDFHRFFSHDKVRGFDRGFDYKKLEPETKRKHSKKSDIRTAKRAVKYIKEKAKTKERFFLFTFFSAPHSTYVNHYKEMPGKKLRDSYRQEVRFVDEQFGRILRAIDEGGIEKDTIVIFAGDHGEAFGEHRTHRHNSQLYRESVHVPLAVYIPGEKATRNSKPVSLFSVFPQLMLQGPKSMRNLVSAVIKEDLAPLHVAMGQGALSELIRLKKMLTRVDLGDRVLLYDHVADRITRYEDIGEKEKLRPTKEDTELIERLGRLRSTRKRFTKKVNYSPWRRFKKKK